MQRIVFLISLFLISLPLYSQTAQQCAGDREYFRGFQEGCARTASVDYAGQCGTEHCQNNPGFCPASTRFEMVQTGTYIYARCITYTCAGNVYPPATGVTQSRPIACFRNLVATVPPKIETPVQCSGSIIEPTNQVLGEVIPVLGASFDLVYFSNRVVGRTKDYTVEVNINNPPAIVQSYAIGSDSACSGGSCAVPIRDNLGVIPVTENMPAYTFSYQWSGVENNIETWAGMKRDISVNENTASGPGLSGNTSVVLGSLKAKKLGLGGWVPSIWHFYSKDEEAIYFGDGSRKIASPKLEGSLYRYANEEAKEVYYFDSTGKIISTKYGLTGETKYSFTYDSSERLMSITEPFNRITTFSRYVAGALKAIIAPKNIKTTILINPDGYLTKATNPAGESYDASYTSTGLMTSFTKPTGEISTFTYGAGGILVTDSSNSGKSSTLSSIPSGVKLTSAMGNYVDITYDATGKMETTNSPGSAPTNQSGTEFNFFYQDKDIFSSQNKGYDPRFPESLYTTSRNISSFGSRSTNIDRTASLTNPLDPFSINTLTMTSTSYPGKTTSVYNGATKTFTITSKLGKTKTVQIDNYERPILEQVGDQVATDFIYTDNLLTKITKGTRKNVFTYYANNLLKSVRNSLDQITTFTYDDAQRLKTTILPDSRVINYTYDSNGNLKNISAPGKPQHDFEYELDGTISTYTPPVVSNVTNTTTEYTYNADRKITNVTRPDGKAIDYNYNSYTGFLESITGDFTTINQQYDGNGHLSLIQQGSSTAQMDYTGPVVSKMIVKDTAGAQLYRFDRSPSSNNGGKVGQEKLVAYANSADQKIVNYTYDNDDYLISAGDMTLEYNTPNGQLTKTTMGHFKDYYYYNPFGELKRYVAKHGIAIIYEYELERDSTGRIIKKTETLNNVVSIFDYTYDSAGRLTQVNKNGAVDSTYVYDSNGNRVGGTIHGVATNGTYDDQDRLTIYNGVAYQYNANGDLTSKGNETFEYDVFGTLKKSIKGASVLTYDSDPLQRRMSRVANDDLKSLYAYNPEGKLIGQMDDTGKLVKTFVYATKSHVPDYYIDQNNRKFKIVTDHLGSVRLVVANSGRVLQMMEHDEFGRVVQDTRPGFLPFGFAGGIYDRATGLTRFGFRDYDALTGRWSAKDPIRFGGGDENLYGYVLNDPINYVDPTGKFFIVPITIGIITWLIPEPTHEDPERPLPRFEFNEGSPLFSPEGPINRRRYEKEIEKIIKEKNRPEPKWPDTKCRVM